LDDIDFVNVPPIPMTAPIEDLNSYVEEAKRILSEAPLEEGSSPLLSEAAEALRWFPTPTEVRR
jgi:hypothetical protein